MRRNLRTRHGRALMEGVIEARVGGRAGDVSLLHVLFYIASADGIESLISTEGGAQQDRFVGGSQSLALRARRVARRAPGHPVRRIEWSERRRDRRGRPGAPRAVVALPPALAGRIRYLPGAAGAARPAHPAHRRRAR